MTGPGGAWLEGWSHAYVVEIRQGRADAPPRLVHTATVSQRADEWEDVRILDTSFNPDDPRSGFNAPALMPFVKDPRRFRHHVRVDQPTHIAGSLYADREVLAVRAIPPTGGRTGTRALPVGPTGRPVLEPPIVIFELDPAAEKFRLTDTGTGVAQTAQLVDPLLADIAAQLIARARPVSEPLADFVQVDDLPLESTFLAGSDEYLDEAANAMAGMVAAGMPGRRRPDHAIILAGKRRGLASAETLPAYARLAPELVEAVRSHVVRYGPTELGLDRQRPLHGDELRQLAQSYAHSRHLGQRTLGALLNGARGYAAVHQDGYTMILLNNRPMGFTPYAGHLLDDFAAKFSSQLRRDPATGLLRCHPGQGVDSTQLRVAQHANHGRGIAVLGIDARTPADLPAVSSRAERLVRQGGGYLMRVADEPRLLAFVPSGSETELTTALSSGTGREGTGKARVSVSSVRQLSETALQHAIAAVVPSAAVAGLPAGPIQPAHPTPGDTRPRPSGRDDPAQSGGGRGGRRRRRWPGSPR